MVTPRNFEYTSDVRAHCRRFLLLILMVVLPVQASATASMLDCAVDGRALASAAATVDVMDHAVHDAATDPAAMPHADTAHSAMAHPDMDHADHFMALAAQPEACHPGADQAPQNDAHECQHCATCLVGASMPLPVVQTPLGFAGTQHYALLPDAALAAFFPDGPDRPPRLHLA